MRLMLTHPGASWSTADVWRGLHDALVRQNVEVIEYALDGRLANAAEWLNFCYDRHKDKPHITPPTPEDKMFLAASEIVTRALMFQTDWIVAVACGWLHPLAFVLARRAGLRTGLILTESPNQDDEQMAWANLADVLWTNERSSVARFAALNPNTHYWQHAIDAERHLAAPAIPDDIPAHDVVFVGTGWQERCDLLAAIDWTGIDLGLYGTWDLLPAELRQYVRGDITPNDKTTALYRAAKIGLNLHRTSMHYGPDGGGGYITQAESMNPRCYELAAAGCFFVSDYRAEVEEIFGANVPIFGTPDELQALLHYYLEHDAERQRKAARLPGLVAGQTFDARAEQLLAVLEGYGHV